MNRTSYHIGAPGAVPKAPLPFTLPSRKREGGAAGADGHIAGAGAKWASPGAATAPPGPHGPGHPGSLAPPTAPVHGQAPSQPPATPSVWAPPPPAQLPRAARHAPATHIHYPQYSGPGAGSVGTAAGGAGAGGGAGSGGGDGGPCAAAASASATTAATRHAAVGAPGTWSGPNTKHSPAPRTDFPSLPAVVHRAPSGPTQALATEAAVPDRESSSSRPSLVAEEATSLATPALKQSRGEADQDVDWADDQSAQQVSPLATPLPEVVLPPASQPSDWRQAQPAHLKPSQPPRNNTRGAMGYSVRHGVAGSSGHAPPAPYYAAAAAALEQEVLHSARDPQIPSRHSRPPAQLELAPTSLDTTSDLDIETVKHQHDLMKRKAEIAAERRRAYELEEQRKREGAEQKLRELEARLASRSVSGGSSLGDPHLSSAQSSPTNGTQLSTPKVLLRRNRDNDGTAPPSELPAGRRGPQNALTSTPATPAEAGEKLAAIRAAPSPHQFGSSHISVQTSVPRDGRKKRTGAIPFAGSPTMTVDRDGPAADESREQWLERRRAKTEAKEAARGIVRLCVNRATNSRPSMIGSKTTGTPGLSKEFANTHGPDGQAESMGAARRQQRPASWAFAASLPSASGQLPDVRPVAIAGAGCADGDGQTEPPRKKPGRKRGGRVERSKRERREARAAAEAAAANAAGNISDNARSGQIDDLSCKSPVATDQVASLVVTGSDSSKMVFHASGGALSAPVPLVRPSLIVVDSSNSAGAWDLGTPAVPPTSFDDISRAFANHPTTIPLAGAPLVGSVALPSTSTAVLSSTWAAGPGRQSWDHAKPSGTSGAPSAWAPSSSGAQISSVGGIGGWGTDSTAVSLEYPPQKGLAPVASLPAANVWTVGSALQSAAGNSSTPTPAWQSTRRDSTGAWISAHFTGVHTAVPPVAIDQIKTEDANVDEAVPTIEVDARKPRASKRLSQKQTKKRPEPVSRSTAVSAGLESCESIVPEGASIAVGGGSGIDTDAAHPSNRDRAKANNGRGGRPRVGGRRGGLRVKGRPENACNSGETDRNTTSAAEAASNLSNERDMPGAVGSNNGLASQSGGPCADHGGRDNGKRRSRGRGRGGGRSSRGGSYGQGSMGSNVQGRIATAVAPVPDTGCTASLPGGDS